MFDGTLLQEFLEELVQNERTQKLNELLKN
jgi:hypothetical protein